MFNKIFSLHRVLVTAALAVASVGTQAACLDNVVLVHGNTASPSSWNNTVSTLKGRGYVDSQLYRPNWGSKTCAACNSHDSTNTGVVIGTANTQLAGDLLIGAASDLVCTNDYDGSFTPLTNGFFGDGFGGCETNAL